MVEPANVGTPVPFCAHLVAILQAVLHIQIRDGSILPPNRRNIVLSQSPRTADLYSLYRICARFAVGQPKTRRIQSYFHESVGSCTSPPSEFASCCTRVTMSGLFG